MTEERSSVATGRGRGRPHGRRRTVVTVLVAALAGAAAVLAAAAVASGSPEPVEPGYQGATQPPAPMPSDAAAQQLPDGTWVSKLLPFAGPFPTRDALDRALAQARDEGLIG